MADQPTAGPFKSQAQQRKWVQLLHEGKVTQAQFDAKAEASAGVSLPERAAPRRRTVGASRSTTAAQLSHRRY